MQELKIFFDNLFQNIKFDKRMAIELYQFQVSFTNRNDEHINYFGSGLTGVNVVRFTPSDTKQVTEQIIGIDFEQASKDLLNVSSLNHDWAVSSDLFNLLMLYVTYRFSNTPYLDEKKRIRAQLDTMLILNYKLMCGLLSHYFKYPADTHVAQATFSNLSQRYLIKKLGTWTAWYEFRSKEIISDDSIHRKVFDKFVDDNAVIYAINDIQGRVRDTLKNIYAEYDKVIQRGEKLGQTASVGSNIEGEDEFLDKVGGLQDYVNYIYSISHDYNSLYKEELITVTNKIVLGGNLRLLNQVLLWVSKNSNNKLYIEFVEHLLAYSFNYLSDHSFFRNKRDLTGFLFDLKNGLMTSKTSDHDLINARELAEKITKQAIKEHIGKSTLMSTRTMFMLYIAVRSFKK